MNGNPTELIPNRFTLARMDARADMDVEALERIGNSPAATGARAGLSKVARKPSPARPHP
jgi:hypothetical protein